jgi:hypothetical protein
MPDVFSETFVQCARFSFEYASFNGDTGGAKKFEAGATYKWIWIFDASHDSADLSFDNGFGARTRSASMRAGFEIQIQRSAARLFSRLFECNCFSVTDSIVSMEALAHDLTFAIYYDRANIWIGGRQSKSLPRQFKGAAKKALVVEGSRHVNHVAVVPLSLYRFLGGKKLVSPLSSGSSRATAPILPVGPRFRGTGTEAKGSSTGSAGALGRKSRRTASQTSQMAKTPIRPSKAINIPRRFYPVLVGKTSSIE